MPTVFSGTHPHKVEPRGRVSIPSDFRKVLRDADVSEIYLIPLMRDERSHSFLTPNGLDAYRKSFHEMDLSAEEQRAVDHHIMGSAKLLAMDDMGRIVIPEEYRRQINVGGECTFVGLGKYFEMWEPTAYADKLAAEAEVARRVIGSARITEFPI